MSRLPAPLLATAVLLSAAAAGAAPVTYALDPAHTVVRFEVLHFGTSTLRGRFGPVQGVVVLDREAGSGSVGLRVATAGVDTGLPVLDARLREGDLLASQSDPEAYFVASRFRFDGDALAEVRGEFTLRGTSQPLSLRALHFACHTGVADGREVCGGDFEGFFNRSEFGLSFGLPFVADRVRLLVSVEGMRR